MPRLGAGLNTKGGWLGGGGTGRKAMHDADFFCLGDWEPGGTADGAGNLTGAELICGEKRTTFCVVTGWLLLKKLLLPKENQKNKEPKNPKLHYKDKISTGQRG